MKSRVSKSRSTLFADADNTLWDTDKVFSEAQLSLLGSIERVTSQKAPTQDRLAFVRELDQLIAEKHHARLRYPPRLLVRAVALALAGTTPQVAAKMAWSNISKNLTAIDTIFEEKLEQQFFRELKSIPQLREGVAQGLPELSILGCRIVVFTEGSRERCDLILRHYDLRKYFDQILEGPKNLETFRRLELLNTSGHPAIVVGDQLDRDIAPAKQAGMITIYFPGGFRPKWQMDHEKVLPDYRIQSFEQVVEVARQTWRKEAGRVDV